MANQVKSFRMSAMTVASTSLFHQRFIILVKRFTSVLALIEQKMANYEGTVDTLGSIVNRQRAFLSTAQLKEADELRDGAGGVITGGTKLYLTTPSAIKREAARLVWNKISPYKRIRNHSYAKQTAEVQGMLAALREPEVAAAIELLGFTEEVEILAQANETFLEALDLRVSEKADQMAQSELKSKELMDLANSLYEGIIQVINAYAILQPSEELMAFIKEANGLVGTFSDFSNTGTSGGSAEGGADGNGSNEPDGSDGPTPTPDDGGSEGSEGESGEDGGGSSEGGETPPTTGGSDDDEEVVG